MAVPPIPYSLWTLLFLVTLLFTLYVFVNDAKLKRPPPDLVNVRWSKQEVRETYERVKKQSLADEGEAVSSSGSMLQGKLPPKTGRRYIVIGGAGFLGGWIVLHLIQRGEDPKRIRVLDIRPPERKDLKEAALGKVDFIQVDMTDRDAVIAAFQKPWPTSSIDTILPELTVFHTAATIRFFERHPALQYLSDRINYEGTKNIVLAAQQAGASALVFTSSGSIVVRRNRFWLWPWEREPQFFTQVITDDDAQLPKRHEHFFSNYAVSKCKAERFVRDADRSSSAGGRTVLRTGCIRPGNGIYGPGGDILVDRLLREKVNPTWVSTFVQSFVYVENCSLAHLCYEQRLIEIERQQRDASGEKNPDIGGQAFCVTDSGPTPTYGDVYGAVGTLSNGQVICIHLSLTFMLFIAHLVEWYYLLRHFLLHPSSTTSSSDTPSSAPSRRPSRLRTWLVMHLLPALSGNIVFLQPSMFALTCIHLIFDDSRARLPPAKGGLGYAEARTTLEGVCNTVYQWQKNGDGDGVDRAIAGHDNPTSPSSSTTNTETTLSGTTSPNPGLAFDPTVPEKAVGEIVEKISHGLVDPKRVWN
ncbi:NAD-P-binding protein [Panus rudis PR-1116 ss-1]|nr:NAD-P-binding protein [Panus rudis PR-1116 ss-1]